ncbi:MAG: hypothetical protein AB7F43_02225 [Bacteriovoracia bacterium]
MLKKLGLSLALATEVFLYSFIGFLLGRVADEQLYQSEKTLFALILPLLGLIIGVVRVIRVYGKKFRD